MDLFALKSLLLLLLLSVLGCRAMDDILPPGPLDAKVGTNVTVKTLLTNPQYAFIIWNYSDGTEQIHVATVSSGGLKVNDPYEGRVSVNGTNGYLTLSTLKPEDTGDYSVNVITIDGTTTTGEIKLRVLEPVSDVVITSDLKEAVEKKDTVIVTCAAKGSFLTFAWLNGTAPIVVDGKRTEIKEEELSSELIVRNILRTDLVGPIYCKASNKLEMEKSAPFNFTVFYGPDAAIIRASKPGQYIATKSDFNLTCSVVSNPPAIIAWYHNQDALNFAGPILSLSEIEKQGFGKTMAEYTCKATNDKTKSTVTSTAISFIVMEPINGTVIIGPSARLIAGNSTANLTCQSKAGTVTTTAWTKDGKPLTASSRVVFAADRSSVLISPVQKEDNGKYTCKLTNPVNTDKADYTMTVNYGPVMVKVTGRPEVELDDLVKLTCTADSLPPANVTWKFNGTMTQVTTNEYTIEKAMYSNSGTYTCVAHNAVTGKTEMHTHTLAVKEEIVDGLSDGAIAGIVIAILVGLAAAIGLVFYCRQKVPVESPY